MSAGPGLAPARFRKPGPCLPVSPCHALRQNAGLWRPADCHIIFAANREAAGWNSFTVKNFFCFLIFAALSLVLGLGSARHMVDSGFVLVISRAGPWQSWVHAGSLTADPYTRAHIARSGQLPITSASGLTYFATTDGKGRTLHSDCEYEIVARPLSAVWWTIAVFDSYGKLVPNKASRHAFSSQSLTILPDQTQRIVLAPEARPGHWLPSGDVGDLTLVLRIIRPLAVEGGEITSRVDADTLPRIRRVKC